MPYDLVIVGILLHGFCFDFFFAAGFIHVDNEAPRDIRASGQALFSFLTYGVGMWLGSSLAGKLSGILSYEELVVTEGGRKIEQVTDWHIFWLIPTIGVFASLVVFVLFFRMSSRKPSVEGQDKGQPSDAAIYSRRASSGASESGEAGIHV